MRTHIATKIAFFFILTAASLSAKDYAFFTPPQGWELANPEQLSRRVKVGFLGKTEKEFRPSINLAIEETSATLAEYVSAVQKIHQLAPDNRWRDLGKFNSVAGEGVLTDLETKTPRGNVRILQYIFLKDGYAYILTACSLKSEFASNMAAFEQAISSLELTSNPLELVLHPESKAFLEKIQSKVIEGYRGNFQDITFQRRHWLPFQEHIMTKFVDMGPFWQLLIIQATQDKLK